MVTSENAYRELVKSFETAGLEDARHKALIVFESVARRTPYDSRALTDAEAERLAQAEQRTLEGFPVQYTARRWPFRDLELRIGEGVLIPREETAVLSDAAAEELAGKSGPIIYDLCSGSGAVAISVARALPGAHVAAVELSREALCYLRENVSELAPEVAVLEADVFRFQDKLKDGSLDAILSNPPYISDEDYPRLDRELAYEPRMALCDDGDGFRFYRHIISAYREKLRVGGIMALETGDGCAQTVCGLLDGAGYGDIKILGDCFGMPRAVAARRLK